MNAIEQTELTDIAQVLNERPLNERRGALLLKSYHAKNALYQSLWLYPNENLLREKLLERYRELREKKESRTGEKTGRTGEKESRTGTNPPPKIPVEKGREPCPSDAVVQEMDDRISDIEDENSALTNRLYDIEDELEDLKDQIRKRDVEEEKAIEQETLKTEITKSGNLKLYRKLEDDRKQLFKNRGVWHRTMCNVGTGKYRLTTAEKQERYQLAKMVDDASFEISRISNLLMYYDLNKSFPEEAALAVSEKDVSVANLSNDEAKKRLDNSLMPNISKLRKKLKIAETNLPTLGSKKEQTKLKQQMAKWHQQLAILEAEQTEIRTKLKPEK